MEVELKITGGRNFGEEKNGDVVDAQLAIFSPSDSKTGKQKGAERPWKEILPQPVYWTLVFVGIKDPHEDLQSVAGIWRVLVGELSV